MAYKKLIGFISACALGIAASHNLLAAEKVYTWTDAKGVVHYGEHPPKDTVAKLVHTRTGHSEPTPAPASPISVKESEVDAADDQQDSQKDPTRCTTAKENLKLLNTVARIKTKNTEGVIVYLTEEDKAKQREAMELVIEQSCE